MRRVLVVALLAATSATALAASPVTEQDRRAKSDARLLASFADGCYAYRDDYRQCRTSRDLLLFGSGVSYVAPPKRPRRGQVTLVATGKESYRIESYSRSGNRFYLTHPATGANRRTCRELVNGTNCRAGRW
jgi:hypothetical protein